MARRKVLLGGVFQIIHPGHIHLFRQAAKLGDVYVVVARDCNLKKKVVVREKERLELVKSLNLVKKAFLGDKKNFLRTILKLRPDFILLGPDQSGLKDLQTICKALGLKTKVTKLKKKKKGFSSSELIKIY